jgi:hypothetical protein
MWFILKKLRDITTPDSLLLLAAYALAKNPGTNGGINGCPNGGDVQQADCTAAALKALHASKPARSPVARPTVRPYVRPFVHLPHQSCVPAPEILTATISACSYKSRQLPIRGQHVRLRMDPRTPRLRQYAPGH